MSSDPLKSIVFEWLPSPLPPEMSGEVTELYRCFDAEGRLLYIGISWSSLARFLSHKDQSHWCRATARVAIEQLPTRAAAEDAERHAIATEKPLHNIVHAAPEMRTAEKSRRAASGIKAPARKPRSLREEFRLTKQTATAMERALLERAIDIGRHVENIGEHVAEAAAQMAAFTGVPKALAAEIRASVAECRVILDRFKPKEASDAA
jgi:hypothetical protein